jgi:REP element-mobilizing transposase RayT
MPYINIWIHVVFGTKNREPLLPPPTLQAITKHIVEYAASKNIHINHINGFRDHLHILLSLNHDQSISKVLNLIKGESSHWINTNKIIKQKFEWADEYYAASISEKLLPNLKEYITNQEKHHKENTYKENYLELISKIHTPDATPQAARLLITPPFMAEKKE